MRREDFARQYLKIATINGNEYKCFCPLHDDKKSPSFSFNISNGNWKCFAKCGGGTFRKLAKLLKVNVKDTDQGKPGVPEDKEIKYVPEQEIQECQRRLWTKHGAECRKYLSGRGISFVVMRRFDIGLGLDGRVWIPIRGTDGKCVNVKRYDWLHVTGHKFISYGEGYGANRLWPADVPGKHEKLYLFEGEIDCLLAHSLGVANAVTTTAGAGSWDTGFTRALAGKALRIVYDIDEAGRNGASAIARQLSVACPDTVIGNLPISDPPTGDFTDFAKSVKFDRKVVLGFLEGLRGGQNGVGRPNTTLIATAGEENFQKEVHIRAVVSGKDLTPYQIPNKIEVTCSPNPQKIACANCPFVAFGGRQEVLLPFDARAALATLASSDWRVNQAIKEHFEIPEKCPGNKIKTLSSVPAWEVILVNDLDSEDKTDEYIARRAVSLVDLPPNIPHDFTALATSDPKTQRSILQIKKAESSQTALQAWTLRGKEALLKIWEAK